MKEKINEVVNNLIIQDYILFGSAFILFLVFMIFAIIVKEKKKISMLLVIIAFIVFFFVPTVGFVQMHNYLFKNSLELVSEKKLEFTKAIVIYANLTNLSKRVFRECKIDATAYIKTPNKYKNYILRLKPIAKSSIVTSSIDINQTKEIKMFIEPFLYDGDYEIQIESDCR